MSRMRQVCKEPLLRLGRYAVQSWIRHGALLDISSFHSKVWHLDPRKFMLTPLTHREKSWNIVASPFQYPRFWKERRSDTCRFFKKINSPKLDLYWSKLNSSNKFSKGSMLHSFFLWEIPLLNRLITSRKMTVPSFQIHMPAVIAGCTVIAGCRKTWYILIKNMKSKPVQ